MNPEFHSEAEQMLADAIEILRALNGAVWTDHAAWAITRPETAQAAGIVAAYETWTEQSDGRDDAQADR